MKGLLRVLGGAAVIAALAVPAEAASYNVALGKTVTTSGAVGVMTCCWAPGPLAPLSSVTDGVFLPEGSVWQTNTVWWDERNPASVNNVLEIDLAGNFTINSVAIQGDNNEEYVLHYRDWAGNWHNDWAWAIIHPGAGMRTRSGNVGPIQASAFRIDARLGDEFYSVSEFQANAAPEPGLLALFGLGVAGAIRRRMRG